MCLALAGNGQPQGKYGALAGRGIDRNGSLVQLQDAAGQGQAEAVSQIMRTGGLDVLVPIRPDLAGIPRAIAVTH